MSTVVRQQSLVMTAQEVEESMLSARKQKPTKLVYNREKLMQIARDTDTSKLPDDLDISKLKYQSYAAIFFEGQNNSAINGSGTPKKWIPNKDAPEFTSQVYTQNEGYQEDNGMYYGDTSYEGDGYWNGGGPEWMYDQYDAYQQNDPYIQAATDQFEQSRQAQKNQKAQFSGQFSAQQFFENFQVGSEGNQGKSMDVGTLLGHMKTGDGKEDAQNDAKKDHISFEELLNTVKSSGNQGVTRTASGAVGGSKTVDEIERGMIQGKSDSQSAQYLMSLLHTGKGGGDGNGASQAPPTPIVVEEKGGGDIDRMMDAFLQQSQAQQQKNAASSYDLMSSEIVQSDGFNAVNNTPPTPSLTGNLALDALLQGGQQRPFVQQSSNMPNTEGRILVSPRNDPQTNPADPGSQNNLDALLRVLQGQQQQQQQQQQQALLNIYQNPLQQLMLQQKLQQQQQQTIAASRPGKVVTGVRPPFVGNTRGSQQLPNFFSEGSTGVRNVAGGRGVQGQRILAPNPAAVAPIPPRSITGGGDNDVLQKLLKLSRDPNEGQVQQQQQATRGARIVQG